MEEEEFGKQHGGHFFSLGCELNDKAARPPIIMVHNLKLIRNRTNKVGPKVIIIQKSIY